MKFRAPEITLGALLTVAVFAMGMLFESSHRSPPQQPTATNAAKESASYQPEHSLWNWVTHDAAGFFTLWLVIVGGGQIGLFYWQLRLIKIAADDAKRAGVAAERAAKATEDAVELSRETAQRQLRAYAATKAMPSSAFAPNQKLSVTASLLIFGQTPAHAVSGFGHINVMPYPLKEIDASMIVVSSSGGRTTKPQRAIVSPGENFSITVTTPTPLTNEQFAAINAGVSTRLFLWGRFTYSDIFKKEHFITFCYSFNGASLRGADGAEPCPRNNDTDDVWDAQPLVFG